MARSGRKKISPLKHEHPLFHFDLTLDFHGYTPDEAVKELEQAVYAHESASIMVIHGRGEGVLRQRLRDFALNCKMVRSCDFGEDINIPGLDGVSVIHTV
jgi:dsDNA-specific endonuclease/ATPase MutS2